MDRGIQVERWYEDVRTGQPIVRVAEGELVRVRLRVTVPAERHFVVLDDPLPAGLEPVDLSLRTVSPLVRVRHQLVLQPHQGTVCHDEIHDAAHVVDRLARLRSFLRPDICRKWVMHFCLEQLDCCVMLFKG